MCLFSYFFNGDNREMKFAPLLILFLLLGFLPYSSVPPAVIVENEAPEFVVLKCDFHIHTTYSDGAYTPTQIVQLYRIFGYDVIAITDHDTMDGCFEAWEAGIECGLIVVYGEEVTLSWYPVKHVLALFIKVPLNRKVVNEVFDLIHKQNGLGIVAHPLQSYASYCFWLDYQNCSFIDGWEISVNYQAVFWSGWENRNYVYLLDHDCHSQEVCANGDLSSSYTLLVCHNRTEAGVYEGLQSRRIVVFYDGVYLGSSYALECFKNATD